MKNQLIKTVLFALVILCCISISANAQDKSKVVVKEKEVVRREAPDKGSGSGSGLNDEQKKKIKDINMKASKDIRLLRSQAEEKKVHLKTLSISDKPDMSEVNRTIDEMMSIKANIMKKEAAKRQEIRALLTEEQRAAFDRKHEKEGSGEHQGPPPPPSRRMQR